MTRTARKRQLAVARRATASTENERLRAALDKFVTAFGACTEIPPKHDEHHAVITAWLEAKEALHGR